MVKHFVMLFFFRNIWAICYPPPPHCFLFFCTSSIFSLFLKQNRTDERNQKFNIIVLGRLPQRKVTYISAPVDMHQPESWLGVSRVRSSSTSCFADVLNRFKSSCAATVSPGILSITPLLVHFPPAYTLIAIISVTCLKTINHMWVNECMSRFPVVC